MEKKISYLALAIAVFAFVLTFTGPLHPEAYAEQENANDRLVKTNTIRCGYILYPPYLSKNAATGELQGVSRDLTDAIGQTLNKKIEWSEEIPVGGEAASLAKGGIDAICGITGAYDANAFDQVLFSDYLFIVRNKIYARANDNRFDNTRHLSDLDKTGVSFAGIEGDTSYIFPHMLIPHAGIKTLPALSETAQLFQEVKYGKEDLLMLEAEPGMLAMQANPGVFKVLDIEDPLPTYAAQIAFAKRDGELKNTVDETIRYMQLNGQFEPILAKYDPTGHALIRAR